MKVSKKLLSVIAVISTAVASLVSASACAWYFYQPEEPESLREK